MKGFSGAQIYDAMGVKGNGIDMGVSTGMVLGLSRTVAPFLRTGLRISAQFRRL